LFIKLWLERAGRLFYFHKQEQLAALHGWAGTTRAEERTETERALLRQSSGDDARTGLELLGEGGEVAALVRGHLELGVAGQPALPVFAGEGAGPVGAAAPDLVHVEHPFAERVPDGDEHHAVVRELRHGGERRLLLAAALGAEREEEPRGLPRQRLRLPQAARGVEERLHLRRHHAEPRREAEQDAVGVRQLPARDHHRVLLALRRRVHLRQRLLRQRLRHLPDGRLDAGHGVGALLDLLRQPRHVAVRRVVPDDQQTAAKAMNCQ